jgi:hypothetical protein
MPQLAGAKTKTKKEPVGPPHSLKEPYSNQMEYLPPPPTGPGANRHTPARNKGVSEKWRLRLRESVRMLCNIFNQALWGNLAILNADVASDANNYQGIVSAHFGYCPVILHADNFYAFAGNLGYEGHAFTDDDTFGSPNTVSPVAATDGTVLLMGEVPMLPPPPAVVRAEYARIHTFGDSMAWFIKSDGCGYTRVGAYLKSFHFYNLDDHTRRGAKVADIIKQVRDFFEVWKPADITGTVVPKGSAGHYTNVVPPQDKKDGEGDDEYYSPNRSLVETSGRPRPVFLDADVAIIFVTHNDVCFKTDTGGKRMIDWPPALTLQWEELIKLALCFPRACIVCGGPASAMGWDDQVCSVHKLLHPAVFVGRPLRIRRP